MNSNSYIQERNRSRDFFGNLEVKLLLFICMYNFDCGRHHVLAAEYERTEAIIVHYKIILKKMIFGATAFGIHRHKWALRLDKI